MSAECTELSKQCASGQLTPQLVLMWGELLTLELEFEKIRRFCASSVPIVVDSQEKPDPAWITKWNIAAHSSNLSDSRRLVDFLQVWLN